jgi:hypothetical protein
VNRNRLFLVTLLLLLSACAGRVAPAAPGPTTEPRAAWVITSEREGANESEVCRSDGERPCVLTASTPGKPMTVVVSVYLYAAGAPTKYSGAFLSSFTETASARGRETKVDYTITPGRRPTGVSALGRVTSKPDDYEFRMALFAEVRGHTDPHQFEQRVPVRVVAATGE